MIANQDPGAVGRRRRQGRHRGVPDLRSARRPRSRSSPTRTASEELRSADPADDVIEALTIAQSEGDLNEQEFHNYFSLLMIAGNETTRHTITAGMLALMQNPDQLQLLRRTLR